MSENLPAVAGDMRPRAIDVSYEVALDAEPEAPQPFGEVSADVPDDRLPIVPEWMRPEQARFHASRLVYSTAAHALRSPWYVLQTAFWATVGLFKLTWRRIHWWQLLEQEQLRISLAADGDRMGYMAVQKNGQEARKVRSIIVVCCLVAVAIGVAVLVQRGLSWTLWFGLVAAPWLARHGRPASKPIIRPVLTAPRFRLINLDIVLRAYYAAKLGDPDPKKPDQQVTFPKGAQRDGEGSRVVVDLPYGKSLKDAMTVRHAIASGLDVTESQVYLHRDPSSARRHTLWVADRDPLAVPVGRTPLLACKPTDIWKPAPIGLDERGQLVTVPLMWNSVLVGALPRQGKTFMARQLALYCALDPYVKLSVFDAKGSPDWRKFSLVADSCAFGLTPTKEGLPPEILLQTLEQLRRDVEDRYHKLSKLADKRVDLCPDGKLTRQLARDPAFDMPVRALILDEFQEYYDLAGNAISKDIAKLLAFLVKVAPGAGVMLVGATQRPSGIGGGGETGTLFTSFRDNFAIRFSLRTSEWRVSEMVLGAGALGEGLDSSKLLPQYKGVGILRGASDHSPTTRTFLADGQDAEKILTVARALRERAGTLTGMAAGDEAEQARDVIGDVLAVFGDDRGLQWAELAERLASRFPDRWADAKADAVSAQVRGLGVPGSQVWAHGANAQGCKRMDVESRVAR